MKHIHITNPYNSTAMQRLTTPLLQELVKLYEVTTSGEVDITADLNFHMPWHTLVGLEERGEGKHVIAYTHCNPPDQAALMDACERADLITCMSFEGRRELVEMGVDPKKLWVNYCATDFMYRRRLVGIVGYPQPNARKRESIIMDLAWKYDMTPYQFLFIGAGWDEFVEQLQSVGVSATCVNADTEQKLAEIYNRLDLLLVTGYVEGGPLPLLEAMAAGVKVLSPRFGYAADLLSDVDLYDDVEELAAALRVWSEDGVYYHQLARAWSWKDYVAEYAMLFGRLLGESVDLYPERGVSRYCQLLDIIDEIKPRGIVEIGTWSGSTALRMIQQAAKYRPMKEVYYQGFDLFDSMTGEQFRRELSKHGWNERIVQKRLDATGANIYLREGDTKETLLDDAPLDYGLYFVDGGHSEETIDNDADYALGCLRDENAVAIFDDYYHAGKPEGVGCNAVIDGLNKDQFEITHLPARTLTDDGREIGMVKVRKYADVRLQMSGSAFAGVFSWDGGGFPSTVSGMPFTHAPSPSDPDGELERLAPASGE